MCGEEGWDVGWWKNVNWGAHRYFAWRIWTKGNDFSAGVILPASDDCLLSHRIVAFVGNWDYGKVPIFPVAMEYVCPEWMPLLIIFLSWNRNVRRSRIQEASVTFRPEIFRKRVLGGPCSWHFNSVLVRKFRLLVSLGWGTTPRTIGTFSLGEILMGIDSVSNLIVFASSNPIS